MHLPGVLLRAFHDLLVRLALHDEPAWTVDDLLHGHSFDGYDMRRRLARHCRDLGKTLATGRIYLTGKVVIERGDQALDERALAGRQSRLAFVFLCAHRHRSIARDELTSVIWPDDEPPQPDAALDAILSKLRSVLKKAGWPPDEARVDARSGTVALELPVDTWVDIEAAANALDEAEGALRRADKETAWALSNVVISITRRPLMADFDAPWLVTLRASLRAMLVRALQVLTTVTAANEGPSLAIQYAEQIVELEPFRETAYQQLMRMHAAAGNRAEALRVFARCRELLREELGVSPSPQTETVFLEILRAE